MKTHDEETRQFFKHSSVQLLLCPRHAGKGRSWLKKQNGVNSILMILDVQENRQFILAIHDSQGPTFGCPREPWHDLHCQIDGPAAYDILTNFEERWLKASELHGIQKLKMIISGEVGPMRIERPPEIMGMADAPCLSEDDTEAWHVQVFHSIDSNSVKGFPDDPRDATTRNLVCGKNLLIDMSIHTAYVTAIRAAQHCIYIENQYFIGSSYNWTSFPKLGANNLIPMEIALKIANKIRANERFSAFVVIPMWPEGVPTDVVTQRILGRYTPTKDIYQK
ncbi:hypothetical protein RJ640_023870 [Escallonia rubra]|uniref:Uncharacterized protein n=1 Tax=Escallonia rubra TaxID=112253 RepID=A0AA88R1M2_9ASTE|nr:hypothetical protein RJ640_023870 [Escallonia rubra]